MAPKVEQWCDNWWVVVWFHTLLVCASPLWHRRLMLSQQQLHSISCNTYPELQIVKTISKWLVFAWRYHHCFSSEKKKKKKILVVICWLLWFQCQRAGSSGRFTDGSVPRFQLNPFELRRNNWAEIKGNWHHSAVKLRQILFLWKESFFCFFYFSPYKTWMRHRFIHVISQEEAVKNPDLLT